ncbi:MAG: class A beta-lactamase-related serine hydrolase [Flavobacteriales bacterium]|nr:class A beta-lactamase-related serine hydrolase [Flavobacteriales bacterium]
MMNKKFQWLIIVFTAVVSSVLTYYITSQRSTAKSSSAIETPVPTSNEPYCGFRIFRQDGYKFIQPVQFIQQECESPGYANLKSLIQRSIDTFYRAGIASNISYYFREFDHGAWTSVNPEMEYHPGSMMKLPILITYLKQSESAPDVLDRMVLNNVPVNQVPPQNVQSKQIELGKSYSIRELLRYMISYSDNLATMLLLKNVDQELYKDMYKELHMEVPDLMDFNFTLSTIEYSYFLSAVFNGSYFNEENSEYAMELLSTSDFKNGMVAGLPPGMPIVHKFGEWSDGKSASQFHEAGVIYFGDKAYMIIIMTDGDDNRKLPPVIADLTRKTVKYIQENGLSKHKMNISSDLKASL